MNTHETKLKKTQAEAQNPLRKGFWQDVIKEFQGSHIRRSLFQLINTFVPYILLWALMVQTLKISYVLTLLIALPTAGLLIRLFIIFHDCGHGSFFKSQKVSDYLGSFLGMLVMTPYLQWRHEHAVHHACAGNLEKRGVGDIWTMTVREYTDASRWMRFKYRVYRNPVMLFLVLPLMLALVIHRIPVKKFSRHIRKNVHVTNIGILCVIGLMTWLVGFKAFIMIQLPILIVYSTCGVWLFYIQHQFEDMYWENSKSWDYTAVAFEGSSFYRLPKILHWFTGNIGFHHIHHLSPKIPNYLLDKCHKSHAMFQDARSIGLRESLKSLRWRLWDENQRKMVSFRFLKKAPA